MLTFDAYGQNAAPIPDRLGCDSDRSRGGDVRGTFLLSARNDKLASYDFEQAWQQVWGDAPAHSPLLVKPLALGAGGAPHP